MTAYATRFGRPATEVICVGAANWVRVGGHGEAACAEGDEMSYGELTEAEQADIKDSAEALKRLYYTAGVLAGREQAAAVCDARANGYDVRPGKPGYEVRTRKCNEALDCAAAIRAEPAA